MKFDAILKENYKFRFKSDSCSILGFENEAELSIKYSEGTKVPYYTRNVDKMRIYCSIVDSSIVNGDTTSDMIWSIVPKQPRIN